MVLLLAAVIAAIVMLGSTGTPEPSWANAVRACACAPSPVGHARGGLCAMPCTWPGDLKLRGGGGLDGGVGGLLDVLPANVRGLVDALDDTSDTQVKDAPADVASEKEEAWHPGRRRPPAPEGGASSSGGSSLPEPEHGSQEEEATAKDMRESEALQRALGKWRENMKERAKNPRIALMEHPKWGWIQVYTYTYS